MFFIVNHENSIIAADADFLEGIGADNIYEAALLIKKGEVVLDELEQSISYLQKDNAFSKTELSTFLGDAYLYEINEEDDLAIEDSQDDALLGLGLPQEHPLEEPIEEEHLDTDEEKVSFEAESRDEEVFDLADAEENPPPEEDFLEMLSPDIPDLKLSVESEEILSPEEESDMVPDEIIGLIETDNEIAEAVEKPALLEEAQDLDLMISDEAAVTSYEPDTAEVEGSVTEEAKDRTGIFSEATEPVTEKNHTNFQEIAKLIGVSEEEYLHFLDDFRKESLRLEPNLRSNDLRESREALSILTEASLLLHLPQMTEKLNILSNATSDEKSSIVGEYLEMVTKITHTKAYEAPTLDLTDDRRSLGTSNDFEEKISLDQIQAIPFDFSINEAADELTLPASLVSEFVVDFISQAKENLPILHKAYEEKDLDTIHTTAHMLKGASSNLRIIPMAETLYELQFNEDFARVPELITMFSGQLKALSTQMDQA